MNERSYKITSKKKWFDESKDAVLHRKANKTLH